MCVQKISCSSSAFAAIRVDGAVVTWGSKAAGGDACDAGAAGERRGGLRRVVSVTGSCFAFAALKEERWFEMVFGVRAGLVRSLRLTWKLPEGLCKSNQVFQRGPGSFHVSLGEGRRFLPFAEMHMFFCFRSMLALKGVYHYWTYVFIFCQGILAK